VNDKNEFESLAAEKRENIATEFIDFLRYNKKWWLLPLLICILGLGALVLLSGTALGPFIYTLF
jgi:hypothetical protein